MGEENRKLSMAELVAQKEADANAKRQREDDERKAEYARKRQMQERAIQVLLDVIKEINGIKELRVEEIPKDQRGPFCVVAKVTYRGSYKAALCLIWEMRRWRGSDETPEEQSVSLVARLAPIVNRDPTYVAIDWDYDEGKFVDAFRQALSSWIANLR